jgi:hypothetical protein
MNKRTCSGHATQFGGLLSFGARLQLQTLAAEIFSGWCHRFRCRGRAGRLSLTITGATTLRALVAAPHGSRRSHAARERWSPQSVANVLHRIEAMA